MTVPKMVRSTHYSEEQSVVEGLRESLKCNKIVEFVAAINQKNVYLKKTLDSAYIHAELR